MTHEYTMYQLKQMSIKNKIISDDNVYYHRFSMFNSLTCITTQTPSYGQFVFYNYAEIGQSAQL